MSRIGIIAAMPKEAYCLERKILFLRKPVEIEKNIFVCISGVGEENALLSAKKLYDNCNVNALISWGVAGSINSIVKPGDLIIAKEIIGDNIKFMITQKWLNEIVRYLEKKSIHVHVSKLTSTTNICSTITAKKNLSKATAALAVDMESAAIASFSQKNNIDFLAIRSIADDHNTNIPAVICNHTDEYGQPALLQFIFSCLKNPSQIYTLIKIGVCYKKALNTLKKVSTTLKKQHFLYHKQP